MLLTNECPVIRRCKVYRFHSDLSDRTNHMSVHKHDGEKKKKKINQITNSNDLQSFATESSNNNVKTVI